MSRRFIWDERIMEWVPFALYRPPNTGGSIHLIKDDLGVKGVYNPATGKTYDSKSQYYAATRAKGSHIIEKGEPMDGSGQRRAAEAALGTSAERARHIKTAIEQLKAGYRG